MSIRKQPDFWMNLADVLVLWSLAVAQPLYSLLATQPTFFVARGAGLMAILIFVVTLSLALPLLVFAFEFLFGGMARHVHFAIISVLTGLLIFGPLKKLQMGGFRYFAASLLVGVILAGLYLYFRRRAFSMVVLTPVVVIFPLIFLLSPSIRSLLKSDDGLASFPKVSADAPIIMVVFDEFPVVTLMKENQELDAGRYPHFAALAKEATWFRNDSAVGESTAHGLSALLDGLYPDPSAAKTPTAVGHPHSLFALFGGSYRFNVVENMTRVCPDKLRTRIPVQGNQVSQWLSDVSVVYLHTVMPTRFSSRLPDVSHSWKNYGADKLAPLSDSDDPKYLFEEFLKRIQPSDSTLNFIHLRLPHFPWLYLPDGRRYCEPETVIRGTAGTNDVGEDPSRWIADRWVVTQGYQRHLLQVGMADWLIGRLINRLKELDIYDESLIIITADHGASFRQGDSRRVATATNYVDIAAVPLFIKKPNQTAGAIDDRNVEAIDVLPTIADILGIQLPWKVDGVSAESASAKPRAKKYLVADSSFKHVMDPRLSAKNAALQQQLQLFGSGDWRGVYRVGLPPHLVEARVSEFSVSNALPIEYEITEEPLFRDFNPAADSVRTLITGELTRERGEPWTPLRLIVTVNDRIVAYTESYHEGEHEKFAAVTADTDYSRGSNLIELFALTGPDQAPVLARLRKRAEAPYELGKELTFGEGGAGVRYLAKGWSFPEKSVRWTDGQEAEIVLPMARPQGLVILKAELAGYLPAGKLNRQEVRILVNHQKVGQWTVRHSDFAREALLLPPEVFKNQNRVVLTFETPDAVSPFVLGVARDVRRLAFALRSLTLSAADASGFYKWGETLDFGSGGNSLPYRLGGWSGPEAGISWNDGTKAELAFPMLPPKGPVVMELFAKPFLFAGKVDRQRLRVLVNGQPAGEITLTKPDFQEIAVEIPANLFGASGAAALSLETPDAASPREIGAGPDQRRLAIAVKTLKLRMK